MKAVSYWIDVSPSVEPHEGTDEVVCPYCYRKYAASWEFDDDGIEVCQYCNKRFRYERIVEVTYNSQKDCELNEDQHDWTRFGKEEGVYRCTKCSKMGFVHESERMIV